MKQYIDIEYAPTDPDDPSYVPYYSHEDDAGADLCAMEHVTIKPGERVAVSTGMAVAIPRGFAGFIHPRSGLALKSGVTVLNAPGTIDSGYRGEIKVILINHDPFAPAAIRRGDRIAQLIIQPVIEANFAQVFALDPSSRSISGFGSTGR